MKKRLIAGLLAAMIVASMMATSVFAVEPKDLPEKMKNNIINLACDTTTQLFEDYYEVSSVSGEITGVEETSEGINIIVGVSYTTKIRAETPDDAPYIQGILAAMKTLTDESEIQRANDYLTIWRAELENEHIGRELSHNVDFVVSVPLLARTADVKIDSSNEFLNSLSVENAEVKLHTYDELRSTEGRAVYIDEPLSSLVPTAEEVMKNAYNDVRAIASGSNSSQGRNARASRAKELVREAAAYYARQPSNFPVGHRPDGSEYAHYKSDCANFVSQCFSAGGVKQIGEWYDGSGCWNWTGGPRKSPGHYGVTDYMVDNDIVFCAGTGTGNRAFAGSIMYYPKSLTDQAHIGIVTSNDGQTAYYSAHTTDHCHRLMSDNYKRVMDFYIPVWDSHTNTWTPQ